MSFQMPFSGLLCSSCNISTDNASLSPSAVADYTSVFLGPGCQPKVGILDLLLAMFMVCPMSVRCLLVTTMNCGKTAGPIEMPFGMWGGVGHSHHVLDGGPDPPTGRGNFGVGKGPSHSKV